MKSRTAQLVFQSIYAALALVACVGSVGFCDMKFTSDFYIYFIYPYFFLNPERVGIGGIIIWAAALLAGFVVLGYLFMMADRLLRKKDIGMPGV